MFICGKLSCTIVDIDLYVIQTNNWLNSRKKKGNQIYTKCQKFLTLNTMIHILLVRSDRYHLHSSLHREWNRVWWWLMQGVSSHQDANRVQFAPDSQTKWMSHPQIRSVHLGATLCFQPDAPYSKPNPRLGQNFQVPTHHLRRSNHEYQHRTCIWKFRQLGPNCTLLLFFPAIGLALVTHGT